MRRILAAAIVAAAISPVVVSAGGPDGLPACSSVWVTYGQPLTCEPATGQALHMRYLPSRWSLAEAHAYCASIGGDAAHTRFGNTANVCSNVDPGLLPTPTTTTTTSTVQPTTSSTSTTTVQTTLAPTSTTIPPPGLLFPNPDNTGPRPGRCPTMQTFGTFTTTADGQVIQCAVITGNLRIRHHNVIVRDSVVNMTVRYGIHIQNILNQAQECPRNVLVEYTEVNGAGAPSDYIPIYAYCGATFDHLRVIGGGASIRLRSDSTVTNTYAHGNRRLGDQHRTALSMHGGMNNIVRHNTLLCQAPPGVSGSGGCSAAVSIYGDFAVPGCIPGQTQGCRNGFLLENNLLAGSGNFCVYGGSVDSDEFPLGYDIDIIGNHFSRMYQPNCGSTRPIASFDVGVRGNDCDGNVWHETGADADAACGQGSLGSQ